MTGPDALEDLLRELAPQVLGAVVRHAGRFDLAEDAVQEALVEAATRWPADGWPRNPRAWLITVASRRLIDHLRSADARRRREAAAALDTAEPHHDAHAVLDPPVAPDRDDSLRLLFLCCHPTLTPPARIALTLRAVGGLTTAEIARAFLLPEATMARRIHRAKQRLREAGTRFELPSVEDRDERLAAVLHVLYLVFNEGYTATAGATVHRRELAREAIRLTRLLHELLPDDGEVAGLLALMLLTDARRDARTTPDGSLVPLLDQDRRRWDQRAIAEGDALITAALTDRVPGPYQLQAAIAAVHATAEDAAATDWPQILGLYRLLEQLTDSPVVALNHAVAEAMVDGPTAGLARLAALQDDPRLRDHHRLAAVRAHLLEEAGDLAGAAAAYRTAAQRTTSLPERRYLEERLARLRIPAR